jgi:small-conductance mechanosensitive channel
MNELSNWQILWNEVEKLIIFIMRPAVNMQLLAIALAAIANWTLTKWVRNLAYRYGNPIVANISNKYAQKAGRIFLVVIENDIYPAMMLLILALTIGFVEQQGWPANLIRWSTLFFWALLAYRLLIAALYSTFGQTQVRPFQQRLLEPAFWLLVSLWVLNTFTNLPTLANLELFTLFNDSGFLLGQLFWLGVVLYFLFAFAWLAQEIILRLIAPRTQVDTGTINAALTIGRYIILSLAVLIVFYEIGFDPTSLAVIAGGLSVGVGFGLQAIISNFISGIVLLFEQSLRPGDVVEVGGILGTVEKLNVRATTVRTFDNVEMIIPNETFFTTAVTTYTHGSRITRILLTIGASYNSKPQEVMEILKEAAQRHGLVLDDPAPDVFFENYGNSSIDFHLAIWVADPTHRKRVPSDLRLMIWKEFENRGIEIPFPQRDLHIRSDASRLDSTAAIPDLATDGP